MARKSIKSLGLNSNLRAKKVYPGEKSKKANNNLTSIGLKLSSEQAKELGSALLKAANNWTEIDLTGYRFNKRKSDHTYHITVTTK